MAAALQMMMSTEKKALTGYSYKRYYNFYEASMGLANSGAH